MLTIAFLPDSHDEWKKVNIEKMKIGIDFKTILSQVENDIKSILD